MKANKMPSLELLKASHVFPGFYTFKAIGKNVDYFVERSVAAVRDELGLAQDPPFTTRLTEGNRHVSVTFEILLECAEDVLDVYSRLYKVSGLILLL